MSTAERPKIVWTNVAFLTLTPLLALILVPWSVMTYGLHWSEPLAFFILWWLTGFGVTAGYHRLLSHRAWTAPAPVRLILLIFGAATWQNSAITWAAGHRFHHNDVDTEDDPYNIQEGFLHAHMTWVMIEGARHEELTNVDDLWKDKLCAWQHNNYMAISLAFNLGVPILLGLLTGRIIPMLIWATLLRVVVLHHMTFFINSLAHMWGSRPWDDEHSPRDNGFLALLTLGEGYHNYHHAFPSDYRNGHQWYHFDPTKWLIWSLSKVGLADKLMRVPLDARLRRRAQVLERQSQAQTQHWTASMHAQWDEWKQQIDDALDHAKQARHRLSRAAKKAGDAAKTDLELRVAEAEKELYTRFLEWERWVTNLQASMPVRTATSKS